MIICFTYTTNTQAQIHWYTARAHTSRIYVSCIVTIFGILFYTEIPIKHQVVGSMTLSLSWFRLSGISYTLTHTAIHTRAQQLIFTIHIIHLFLFSKKKKKMEERDGVATASPPPQSLTAQKIIIIKENKVWNWKIMDYEKWRAEGRARERERRGERTVKMMFKTWQSNTYASITFMVSGCVMCLGVNVIVSNCMAIQYAATQPHTIHGMFNIYCVQYVIWSNPVTCPFNI